ncbi:lmo0954 family membrane protein [Robertmurraya korlensis]|uniref:lmo0954 family membrane protein n=1 Tax=Robertmurraya korlensis TaxID=519977 RepID=UPI0008241757|nr:flagellar basal body rod protein [Robertmurraya korlensis]
MKKFGLLLIGGIAALVLLANLGPMVGLVVSMAILYFVFKQFLKTDSMGMKIGLGILGFILLMASISNAPALVGIVAAYILYGVYKKFNETKVMEKVSNDPFQNFEKQWSELKNN